MLNNYFVVALRNLKRYQAFSCINIFGLAIGLSLCLAIIMLVADQLSYDRHNENFARIYRVTTSYLFPDGSPAGNLYATAPLSLGEDLKDHVTGIEKAVRIKRGFGNGWIKFDQDVSIPISGFFADPEIIDIFDYDFLYGNPETALVEPFSVVLTKEAAEKLFTVENPVGEVITVGDIGQYKVTGVLRKTYAKSHIVFEGLASYSTVSRLQAMGQIPAEHTTRETFTAGWVYLLLQAGHTGSNVEQTLQKMCESYKPAKHNGIEERRYGFSLQHIGDITPGPFINNPIGPFMPMVFLYFLCGLALIVILTSCFNYTNLSMARALTRAKEIGVRKVSGASRMQLFFQFLSESTIVALAAFAGGLLLLLLIKPFLLNLQFAQILRWDLQFNSIVFLAMLSFSILIGVLAGFFPAVVLSGFQPLTVLRRGGNLKIFSRVGVRKMLLVVQFALSFVFVVSATLLYNQLHVFIHKDHGFSMEKKINIRLNRTAYLPLKTELLKQGNISSVAAASHVPAAGTSREGGFKVTGTDNDFIGIDYFHVDQDYLNNLSLTLRAGKNFTNHSNKASHEIIINEKAVDNLALESPHDALGKIIFSAVDSTEYEIVGVLKNYNHQFLMSELGPMALLYDESAFNILQVQYLGERDAAISAINTSWKTVNPNQNIDYIDFEAEVHQFYDTIFSDVVKIVSVITAIAILISCLGLLGMATYSTQIRTREISIRKVLGSSSEHILLTLSKGYIILVLIAVAIGLPIAYFVSSFWLEFIAYRTEFSVGVVAFSLFVLTVLSSITIGSQTLKASMANPVHGLKNE